MQGSKDTSQGGLGINLKTETKELEGYSKTQKHNLFKDYLIKHLSKFGHFVWNNETGGSFGGTHNVKYGFKGSPDIIGIAFNGLFLGVEVKTYSGKLRKEQKSFRYHTETRGGIYYVAHTDAKTFKQMDKDAEDTARRIKQIIRGSAHIGE